MEDSLPITVEEAAPLFGCSARHFRDRLCKTPGFPQPLTRHPLRWTKERLLAHRDAMQAAPPSLRR